MVLKTTFGQSQTWSLIRDTLGEENEERNNLNLANKVFNWQNVLILGGRNSGISLYYNAILCGSRNGIYQWHLSKSIWWYFPYIGLDEAVLTITDSPCFWHKIRKNTVYPSKTAFFLTYCGVFQGVHWMDLLRDVKEQTSPLYNLNKLFLISLRKFYLLVLLY